MSRVVTIDCQYVRPQFAAAFLLIEDGKAAFIENNTTHAVPLLLEALAAEGLKPEQVEYLIVTHAHLDHAGGTAALLAHCPRATVLAHPKAARTLVDPSRLVASARQVYGDAAFEKLYGEIRPIPAARVRGLEDGSAVELGSRTLRFVHVRGHATHHLYVHDSGSNVIFAGDAFGLSYPAVQRHGFFIMPSTSPIDFDPIEARSAVNQIADASPSSVYLTHFGEIRDVETARSELLRGLDLHEAVLKEAIASPLEGNDLRTFCRRRLREGMASELGRKGWSMTPDDWKVLELDLDINGDGIAFVAQRSRGKA